jgi:hypothetical protein
MARKEKNHFSSSVLEVSEVMHNALGHSTVGKVLTKAIAGSQSSSYRQMDWTSRNITYRIKSTIKVPGDPEAGIVPRYWNRAAIMASPKHRVRDLNDYKGGKEAIAYISDEVVHVGVLATEGALFGELNEEELAISMRLGKGRLEATMGIWLPDDREFLGVRNVRLVETSAFVPSLATNYPGISLS